MKGYMRKILAMLVIMSVLFGDVQFVFAACDRGGMRSQTLAAPVEARGLRKILRSLIGTKLRFKVVAPTVTERMPMNEVSSVPDWDRLTIGEKFDFFDGMNDSDSDKAKRGVDCYMVHCKVIISLVTGLELERKTDEDLNRFVDACYYRLNSLMPYAQAYAEQSVDNCDEILQITTRAIRSLCNAFGRIYDVVYRDKVLFLAERLLEDMYGVYVMKQAVLPENEYEKYFLVAACALIEDYQVLLCEQDAKRIYDVWRHRSFRKEEMDIFRRNVRAFYFMDIFSRVIKNMKQDMSYDPDTLVTIVRERTKQDFLSRQSGEEITVDNATGPEVARISRAISGINYISGEFIKRHDWLHADDLINFSISLYEAFKKKSVVFEQSTFLLKLQNNYNISRIRVLEGMSSLVALSSDVKQLEAGLMRELAFGQYVFDDFAQVYTRKQLDYFNALHRQHSASLQFREIEAIKEQIRLNNMRKGTDITDRNLQLFHLYYALNTQLIYTMNAFKKATSAAMKHAQFDFAVTFASQGAKLVLSLEKPPHNGVPESDRQAFVDYEEQLIEYFQTKNTRMPDAIDAIFVSA